MDRIEFIEIEKLQHHPDNPRKDYGDLSELAESIKTNGIMQNLTVVLADDDTGLYNVIIGNRRLEAAKLAGLTELPCAVVELTPQEQMATMLAENMQRADLTVLEQARGFQYMLDLGESVKSVSEKTGFSETTVRRRVKLMELDAEKLERAFERAQISIDEIDKINSIEDVEARNSLLEKAGTGNFEWALKSVQSEQERRKLHAAVRELLDGTGLAEVSTNAEWGVGATKSRVGAVNIENPKTNEKLKKAVEEALEKCGDKSDSYALSYGYLYLYTEKKAADTEKVDEKEQAERGRRVKNANELKRASKTAFELRREFIKNYPKSKAKEHFKVILHWLAMIGAEMTSNDDDKDGILFTFGYFNNEEFIDLSDIGKNNAEKGQIPVKVMQAPEKLILSLVYTAMGDSESYGYLTWDGRFYDVWREQNELSAIYGFLTELGYEMSDEEKSLKDGTHTLFYKPEAEDGKENENDT